MEDILEQLASSPEFRQLVQKEVRCCFQERQESSEPDIKLDSLIKEIGSYMASITEYALEEENSDRFFGLLKKNEEMYEQLEKRMQIEIQVKMKELSQQLEQIKKQLKRTTKQLKARPTQSQRLKTQRRTITKSILETSAMFGKSKAKSTIEPGCLVSKSKYEDCDSESEFQERMVLTNDSRSRELENSYQLLSNKENCSTSKELLKKVDSLMKDQAAMSEQINKIAEKTQSDLQLNLQGVWNVISDLNNRISKFQSTFIAADNLS